jgi:hypothetical protein
MSRFTGDVSDKGLRASEKDNYPILLVFRPDFGVAPSGEYPDMPRSTRLKFGPNSGAILGYLFISEALTPFPDVGFKNKPRRPSRNLFTI